MTMNDKDKILIEKLRTAKSVAIIGHKNPDGDALGSALAMCRLIEMNFGISPVCTYDGNIPEALGAVPLRSRMRFVGHLNAPAPFDVVILVDYGTARHLEFASALIENAGFVVEIDHHKNDAPIAALCFDDDTADATAVIIYEMMRRMDWRFDGDVLNLLALGIITDTGHFKFVKSGRSMRIMADLVDGGVKIGAVYDMLNNQPKKTILVEAKAAASAEFFYRDRLAVATITNRDYKNMDGRGENVLDILSRIKGVEYIALLKQQKDNQIGVSLRGRRKPVNSVAAALGGGGHLRAAGAVVRDSLENVHDRVVELFRGI